MDYLLHLAILIAIYGIATVSLNAVAGFTGILSLSHSTFVGVGAYATAILTTRYHWNFFPSVVMGIALAAIIAWLVSYPLFRLKHDSFILGSFGFAIIAYHLLLNLDSITNGPLGIKGILAPKLFGISFLSKPFFLLLVLVALLLTYLFFRHITRSPYGTILKSIRENETVSSVNGHNVDRYKRSLFATGALFASLSGSFLASYLSYIDPKLFDLMPSVLLLIMIVLGGLGNLKGSILGAAILLLMPELLRFIGLPHTILAETQQIIYGLILVLLMFLRPQGLMGDYRI